MRHLGQVVESLRSEEYQKAEADLEQVIEIGLSVHAICHIRVGHISITGVQQVAELLI